MFATIDIDPTIGMQQRCNALTSRQTMRFKQMVADFKADWIEFWEPSMSVEEMQLQLDILASQAVTHLGEPSNNLKMFFDEATKRITYILARDPDAFNDASAEIEDQISPTGQPYRMFLTPGRYYTIDQQTGRLIVGLPCVYKPQGTMPA